MKVKSGIAILSNVAKNAKRVLAFAWGMDRFLVFGFLVTSALSAFFPIISNYIYKLFVDNLIEAQKIAPTIPVILLALMGARFVLEFTWTFVQWGLNGTYFDHLLRYKFQNELNYKFFRKVSSLDLEHLEDPKIQNKIVKAQDTFTWRIPGFFRDFGKVFLLVVSYVTTFVILIPYGWWIPIVLTLFVIPRLFLRARYGNLQWSIYSSNVPEVKRLWYLRNLLSEKTSVIESRIFQSRSALLARFRGIQKKLYERNKKPVARYLKLILYPQTFEIAAIAVFSFLKLPEVVNGQMSVGDFTFFLSILDRLTTSALDIVYSFGDMYENNLYVNHYFDVLALPNLIKDPAKPISSGDISRPPEIEFKNVTFSYPGSRELALDDVSFTLKPAENIAVVGHNGAGKTTIVKLLCRFYDIDKGEILINGVNIKQIRRYDLYKYLGTLFQQFVNYSFTVAENIMLGAPKIRDRGKMHEAARMSGADEFISKFPKKYNQLLGREFEGGKELSYGQWQKLAIARAFYEGAPVLILDEPTSAIDADAEYEIFENLHKYYKDKTLFLISHRFSTVRNADQIIVLDKGKIVEEGAHEDLLANGKLYARMFSRQAKGYL